MKKHLFSTFGASRTLAVSLVALTVLGSGCNKSTNSSDTKSAPGKPKVALVMKSLANEFFSTMAEGAKKHQADNATSYDLVVNGIKNETDLAEQVMQQMAELVENRFDLAMGEQRGPAVPLP